MPIIRTFPVRFSLLLLTASCSACSGNVMRAAAVSHLSLSVFNSPAEVGHDIRADLILRIANSGDFPVVACVVAQTVGLSTPDGHVVPVAFGGSFDGGCLDQFALAPHSFHDIVINNAAFPPVPGSEAALFARLRIQLPLGQFYWPSKSYTLLAPDQPVRIKHDTGPSLSGA